MTHDRCLAAGAALAVAFAAGVLLVLPAAAWVAYRVASTVGDWLADHIEIGGL